MFGTLSPLKGFAYVIVDENKDIDQASCRMNHIAPLYLKNKVTNKDDEQNLNGWRGQALGPERRGQYSWLGATAFLGHDRAHMLSYVWPCGLELYAKNSQEQ